MARVCLPKKERDQLLKALRSGEVSIQDLYGMKSAERNTVFSKYVGGERASAVNAKFEEAMISSQKTSMKRWVQNTLSKKDPIRRDMLKKVDRIQKALTTDEQRGFLKDLAEMKLGIAVSEDEAKTILSLKRAVDSNKNKWDPIRAEKELEANPLARNAGWLSEEDRIAYGLSLQRFKEYVGELKLNAETPTWRERMTRPISRRNLIDFAGATKSMVATLDNSFIGRQGWKVAQTNPKLWADTAVRSFKVFGRELAAPDGFFGKRGDEVMAAVQADIWSRPNALNGKYRASKNGYGLGVLHEEAFPSSLPSRVPILRRVFKASETAFNASALYMRAGLADATIAMAEKNGLDMLDEDVATSFGKVVASMTGRGDIGRVAAIGEEINAAVFSIRFLKANFDTLTAHQLDWQMSREAKKLARKNLFGIIRGMGALLTVAKIINPDSTDLDPRSSKFGKICNGNHCYDVTGGLAGLLRFGVTTLTPTYHNGEWGLWKYNYKTKQWSNLSDAKFGEQTALDSVENFFEGKLSPVGGALRDVLRGQNFSGEKPDFVNTSIGLITPISFEMFLEELQKGNGDIVPAMVMESLGFSPSDRGMYGSGTRWSKLKDKVGAAEYNVALKTVTENFNERAEELENSTRFKRMDNENQRKELMKIRREITDSVLNRYGI